VKRSALLIGLLALAAACGPDEEDSLATVPDVTPTATSVEPTSPETTTATTSPASDPATTTTPSTSATPTTAEPPVDTTTSTAPPAGTEATAVVYASGGDTSAWLPVGWWDGTGWGSVDWPAADVVLPAAEFETVSVASLDLEQGPLQGLTDFVPALYGCIDVESIPSIARQLVLPPPQESTWWGYRAVGVTDADWDLQPRPVRSVGIDDPEYQQLGESLAGELGAVDPTLGDVVQVVRADLDGNGIEEVFVTFEHVTDRGMGADGDFSIVVARSPNADGTVVDGVLFSHVVQPDREFPSPDYARLLAVADLNGDGVMEVAVGAVYWESAGVQIFEFRDGALHQVMSSGCGS
jgi:hypothetical protein